LGDEYARKARENENKSVKDIGLATPQQISCCPNPVCGYQFVHQGESLFSCPKCYKRYCLPCRVESYIHGESCEEYRNRNMNDTQYGFKRGYKFKECSQCKHWNEKNDDSKQLICRCGTETCLGCGHSSFRCNCGTGGPAKNQGNNYSYHNSISTNDHEGRKARFF